MLDESDALAFNDGLNGAHPPEKWSEGLRAMWFDAKGNWKEAHHIAQDLDTLMGSWIHAYLHRKEGDDFNAGYWYRLAKRKFPNHDLETEREEIIRALFSDRASYL